MFTIDFFELAFLVEACIPPVAIARYSFWTKVIDSIYYQLTNKQREQLYVWITDHPRFNIDNEDCNLFHLRYNPHNQYEVSVKQDSDFNITVTHKAFLHNDEYYISMNTRLVKNRIVNINKL